MRSAGTDTSSLTGLTNINRLLFVLICLLGIAVNALIELPALSRVVTGINDFVQLYSGGKLAGTGNLYNPEAVLAIQSSASGVSNPNRLYCRPPFYAAVLWPLARLPYRGAYALYTGTMLAFVVGFILLLPISERRLAILACCCSLPLFNCFVMGQDVPLLIVSIGAVLFYFRQRKHFAAGLVMTLCSIKFHLFLTLPLLILRQKLWRFAGGLAAGGLVLIALSFAAGGSHFLSNFARAATLPQWNPGLEAMPNLHGLFHGSTVLELAGSLGIFVCTWFAAGFEDIELAFAATLAGGLLTSHHAYLADCAILLPVLLLVRRRAQTFWQRHLAEFLLTPFAYLWLFAGWLSIITRLALIAFSLSFPILPKLVQNEDIPSNDAAVPNRRESHGPNLAPHAPHG